MKEKLDIACAELKARLMNPYAIARREQQEQALKDAWKSKLDNRRSK